MTHIENKLKIFCSYAPEDKVLMQRFRTHLRVLELGPIEICDIYDIPPGKEWRKERDGMLQAAELILLLVSSDFISSSENYEQETQIAMIRHNTGQAHVIPIILRPVDWGETIFSKLPPLPSNGEAVTSNWQTEDHAFLSIIKGLKQTISSFRPNLTLVPTPRRENATEQLTQILQNFKQIQDEIARSVTPRRPRNFSLADTEVRYNQLYGDALVFLATYLPEMTADTPNNFAEAVYRKTRELLRRKSPFDIATVFVARTLIPYLAGTEKLGMQVNACLATLEDYQQRYFIAT